MNKISVTTAAIALLLSGCAAVGPDFKAPATDVATSASYRHAPAAGEATALSATWWTVFQDTTLDALEQQALAKNPNVEAAYQRLEEARAQLGVARSDEGLKAGVSTSAAYQRTSENTSQAIMLGRHAIKGMNYTAGASLSYEVDIWGRVRRAVESADAQALAAQDDRDGVLLMLSGQVAGTYWQLRGLDADIAVLEQALATRRESEQLIGARFDNGLSNELDLSRARVERANAESDLQDARRQRLALEHGLAVLLGASPSTPVLPVSNAALPLPPAIPVGLPASLLGQRPDLAGSVATLRALNAQVGVAQSAFYPSVSLTGNFGYASQELNELAQGGSRQFSVGPLALSLPIFDGGRNQANLDAAKARYAQAVANHEGKLLTALREVEDALSDVQQRQLQADAQAQAQTAAARAYEVAQARYDRGVSSYLDVTDAQRSHLAADRAAAQIRTQRLLAAVTLARSLGGGWSAPVPGPVAQR
ncbi:efflux transporter outer membrane subunit [Paucibacter sp. R3-3]|uniref:Efflux transporter outer membrane subunit n=1 Tax=Roseateles agri TaxID=3098619 RepID=A0ABU5DM17_9BURK|nr:efflux transporter outer membrane subunit [Paucibacter sp. R3-3]MDY0747189.1 efflux transporter outer membrane subunit [Paucibacter sp. R3-3]